MGVGGYRGECLRIKAVVHITTVVAQLLWTELCPAKFQWLKRPRTLILFPFGVAFSCLDDFIILSYFQSLLDAAIDREARSSNLS